MEANKEKQQQTAAMIGMGIAAFPVFAVYASGVIAYEALNKVTFGKFGEMVEAIEDIFKKRQRKKEMQKETSKAIRNEGTRLLFEKDVKDFYRGHFKNENLFHPQAGKNQDKYLKTPNKDGLKIPDNIHTLLKKAGFTDIKYYPSGYMLFELATNRLTHNPNPLPRGIDKKQVHDLIVFANGDYIFHDGKNNIYDNSSYLSTTKHGHVFKREIKINGEKIRD